MFVPSASLPARRSWARIVIAFALLAGTLVLSGCPKKGASTVRPQEALEAYAKALRKGNYEVAYGLMSEKLKKRYRKAEFVKALKQNPSEVKRLVDSAGQPREKLEIQAVLNLGAGESIRLKVEKGKWRLASDPIDFYGQKTPREALRSFIRAVERRRYSVVLRFVPAKWASAMTIDKLKRMWEGDKRTEVQQLLKELKENANAPIQVNGSRAKMPYGADKRVSFVREEGLWKVEDPD